MRENATEAADEIEVRLATRLAALRQERGVSLDDLAKRTGISRATLSRIERGEASPTATMLNRICGAHGWTLSRLMAAAEGEAPALVRREDQPAWTDPATGFRRRAASPPGPGLRIELVEGELPAGAVVDYDAAPVPAMEQHILLLSGALEFTESGQLYAMRPGDCVRVKLRGPTRFHATGRGPARYVIAICPP